MLIVYGLKNCDTCRNARKWLTDAGVDYRFADLRDDGLTSDDIAAWCDAAGWQELLNKRSTTWRQLPAAEKLQPDAAKAQALMLRFPALIKRPVFVIGDTVMVGFNAPQKTVLASL